MIDIEKLEAGLGKLRGYDLIEMEKEERLTGNNALALSTSMSYQARVAARALGINPHDLMELPANEFHQVCLRVFGFLNASATSTT